MTSVGKTVLFVLLHLFILFRIGAVHQLFSGSQPMWDFDIYIRTIHELAQKQSPYFATHMELSAPPLVLLPFVPFAIPPLPIARSLMLLLSLAALYASSAILARAYFFAHWNVAFAILSTLLLSAFPTRFSLILGQPTLFLTFALSILMTTQTPLLKGTLTASLIIIKTYFLPIPLVFLRKQRRTFLWTLCLVASLLVISFLFIPPKFYTQYVQSRASTYLFTPEPKPAEYYSQSLKATMSRFFPTNWYLPFWIWCLVASTWYLVKNGNLSFGVVASSLLSPVLWQQNFVVFFPIYAAVWATNIGKQRLLLMFSFLFWWIEFPSLHQAVPTLLTNILASHYFLSALVLLWLIHTSPRLETALVKTHETR